MLSLHAASALRGVSLRGVSLRGATTRRATTRRVEFFDTTLRDGEQGARRTFTPRSKASIAARLEREVGVDVIDAGMIGTQTSPHDLEGVRRIVRATDRARLNVLAYGARREIDAAARALRGAEDRGRLSLFLRPDDLRGADAAAQTRDVRRAVARAADLFPETQQAATWIFRGDESRRRRGRDADIPWRRVAAASWLLRGYSMETSRGGAAAAAWKFGRDTTPQGIVTDETTAGARRARARELAVRVDARGALRRAAGGPRARALEGGRA